MTTKSNLMGTGSSGNAAVASVGIPTVSLTAAGTTQGTAASCPSDFCVFTTVASGAGAILPANLTVGDFVTVVNHGANALLVYPPTGGKISTNSVNTALSQPSGKTGYYTSIDTINFAASVSA